MEIRTPQHLWPVEITAILFLASILTITFTLALSACIPYRKKNGVNTDLEKAESVQQKQQMCIYSGDSLSYRSTDYKLLTPRLISIGPFHFRIAKIFPMEHLKSDYLQYCLERPSQKLPQANFETKKELIRDFIQKQKKRICQCYESYDSKSKDNYDLRFADCILKDSFFIIELFLRELDPSKYRSDELISCKLKRISVQEDLLLMTNQLPYFFLRELYDFVFIGGPSFDSLAQNYFRKLPLIIGNQEGPENCFSTFFSCMEDCFRSFFYCFWTRHLTTCCNSEDFDGNHVGILISNGPIRQFTDFSRDRVVKGNPRDEGWSSSSSTGNRPFLEATSSPSSRGKGPIHEGSTSSSSTENKPLVEGSTSSIAQVNMTDEDGDLRGDGLSSSREKRPLYEGLGSSSTTSEIELSGNRGPSSSPSRGKVLINEGSTPFSPIGDEFIDVYSATRLNESGVKFKASKEGSLINVKFENGVLSIPSLKLNDDIEHTLQNLMAYEQCAYAEEACICSYIKFMESLVKTEDDAALLIDKGVIVNMLAGGDKEVKELLQRLCKDIVLPSFFYQNVCQKLRNHRKSYWYWTVAGFTHEHFNMPRLFVGAVITTLLILIAFLKFILPYSGIAPP